MSDAISTSSLWVAAAALAVSLVALAITWQQLRIAREVANGVALGIGAERVGGVRVHNGAELPRRFRFVVLARGPGLWCDVVGTLVFDDGRESVEVVERIPRLDNTSRLVEAEYEMHATEAVGWFVVTWNRPWGDGIRVQATRIRIPGATGPAQSGRTRLWVRPIGRDDTQLWRWHWSWKARYWLWERSGRRFDPRRIGSAGRWRTHRNRDMGGWLPWSPT